MLVRLDAINVLSMKRLRIAYDFQTDMVHVDFPKALDSLIRPKMLQELKA